MPSKGVPITDKGYLEMLAKAREKANAVRKAKSDEKKKIKLAEQLEHQKKLADAEDKIKTAVAPKKSAPKEEVVPEKPAKINKSPPPPPPESVSESESESESETESESDSVEEAPPAAMRQPRAKPKPVVEKQPTRPVSAPLQRNQPMTPQQRKMMMAYRSLYQ